MPRGRKVIEVQRREKSFRFYTYACRRGRGACIIYHKRTRRVNLINALWAAEYFWVFGQTRRKNGWKTCGGEGSGRSMWEWSFRSDKFLVIPCASSGRTPRTAPTGDDYNNDGSGSCGADSAFYWAINDANSRYAVAASRKLIFRAASFSLKTQRPLPSTPSRF